MQVQDIPQESRYVLLDGVQEIGEEGYVDTADGTQRILFHTFVSPERAGEGLGSTLVRSVLDDVVASGKRVVPVCPYVKAWLPKHPEYAQHVEEATPAHLDTVRAATSGEHPQH